MPWDQPSPALMSLSVWFMMNLSGATQKSLVPCGDKRDIVGAGKDETVLSALPRHGRYHPSPASPAHHRCRRVHGHGDPAEDERQQPAAQHPAGRGVSTPWDPTVCVSPPAAPAPPSLATGYSRGEEAAGALGQPQAGQEADGEDEDEEEEISQPPGHRGRLRQVCPPPQPHRQPIWQPSAIPWPRSPVILHVGDMAGQHGELGASPPPDRQP